MRPDRQVLPQDRQVVKAGDVGFLSVRGTLKYVTIENASDPNVYEVSYEGLEPGETVIVARDRVTS